MQKHEQTVCVLGLGAMGLPMATRLSSNWTVRAFDPALERVSLAESQGISCFDSAKKACEGSDVVFLAVRNMEQLTAVLFGSAAVADALKPGSVIVLTSTIGMEQVIEVAHTLAQKDIHLVDAPISGGPLRAGVGDLLIVAGATDQAFDAAKPTLEHLASTLRRIGDQPGQGQAMKTVNQLLCGIHIAAAAEALALARRMGLDPEATLETLQSGAAQSFMLGNRGPRMLESYGEEVEVMSRLDLFVKDMAIVTAVAKDLKLSTPIAAAAEQLFLMGAQQGMSAADDSSVIRIIDGKTP